MTTLRDSIRMIRDEAQAGIDGNDLPDHAPGSVADDQNALWLIRALANETLTLLDQLESLNDTVTQLSDVHP